METSEIFQKTIVRDDDEGVDLFAQRGHATLGLRRAAVPLKGEGASHDANRQRADASRATRATTGGPRRFRCHRPHRQ